MSIPHYINEDKSDIRGIKPGWYAMEDNGKLSSGPFSSRHECLSRCSGNEWINPAQCGATAVPCPIRVEGGARDPSL